MSSFASGAVKLGALATTSPLALDVVLSYIDRNWATIPVPYMGKAPDASLGDKWQLLVITAETAPKHFNGARQNIGVILGRPSGGLTDGDLDCREAVALARAFLPETRAIFGRASKPESHRLYVTDLCDTEDKAAIQFRDPVPEIDPVTGKKKYCMIVELRIGGGGKGAQTVFPGSTHASGEPVLWASEGEPPRVDGADLKQAVARLAAAALLVRRYPAEGSRHDVALTLGGALARACWPANEIQKFVGLVARAAGDDEWQERGRSAVDAAAQLKNGGKVRGLPALVDAFGKPVADKLIEWLALKGGPGPLLDDDPPQPPPDPRPTITLRVGETKRAVDELERLLTASDLGLYQRGGLIVSIGLPTWDGKSVVSQIIEERDEYALCEDAEIVAKFLKFDKRQGGLVRAPAPMALIRTLRGRKHRLKLPTLIAVTNCPSISASGELLDQPGYDPKTGVLFDPLGVSFPRVPDWLSRADAEKAIKRIRQLLETFPFVSEDDRAVGLSLIFTAIARRGLDFAPLHGGDAPVAGSGKSKIVDIASILATGHEAPVIAQGKNADEFEKRLSTALMRGDQIIAIDNCSQPLTGDLLNQTLTQLFCDLRILGYSKSVRTQAKALITATANNLVVLDDLTRRSIVNRLDPKCARPELREFDYDPIADAKENRGELVAAVLTVLKAYHNAGCPKRPKPALQSFVPWSNTVRGALMWLGQGDPVRTMERLRTIEPILAALQTVLTAWRDQFREFRPPPATPPNAPRRPNRRRERSCTSAFFSTRTCATPSCRSPVRRQNRRSHIRQLAWQAR
jgi:hypothetical protein